MDRYLRSAGSYPLLTAEQEREAARTLAVRRRELWASLLSYPPLTQSVVQRVVRRFADRASCADPRSVANHFADLDRDQRLAGVIVRELDAIAAQRPPCTNLCEGIDDSSSAFTRYHRRVRAARQLATSARNRFASSNLLLVVTMAKRIGGTLPFADRLQEGNIGLLIAVDRFDPERGFRFSTYATWWIRHAILRAQVERADLVRIPAHLHVLHGKVVRTEHELANRLGRSPTSLEVAAAIDDRPDRVDRAREAMRTVTWGVERVEHASCDLADAELPDLDEAVDAPRNLTLVRGALDRLSSKEREILARRYGLNGGAPSTLRAIGVALGLSRERVRQLQNHALAKVRAELARGAPSRLGDRTAS